jgi:3-dehydroquinate synthase
MKKVKVELAGNSYEIRIGSGLLPRVGLWLKEKGFSGKAAIITDSNVKGLYADTLRVGLANAGFDVTVLEITAGEEQKTLTMAGRLFRGMTNALAERTTPVLALGGGVVGDLAGFVAATYMRGVPLIQVPTTLLAQVDSSIGGKTGVDVGKLKNIVGAFHQPRMVITDIDTLKTLPEEELTSGLAEVIKSAVIRNRNFFNFLDNNMEEIKGLHPAVLEKTVQETVKIKAEVVEKDEREAGLRAILNYGHTVGHALEAVSDFRLKHGQAVAIGMVAAAKISSRMGMLDIGDAASIEKVIKSAGLPVKMPELDVGEVIQAMRHDKKVVGEKVRFVLLKSIGHALVADEVDPSLVEEVLFGGE